MVEGEFAALLAEYEGDDCARAWAPRRGQRLAGTVVSIHREEVFIDIGYKVEGRIPLGDVLDETGVVAVRVGDTIDVRITRVAEDRGTIDLRRAHEVDVATRAMLEDAFQNRRPIEGAVIRVLGDGFAVQVATIRGYCPIAELETRRGIDPAFYVGQRHKFLITHYAIGRDGETKLKLSRRALLLRDADTRRRDARESLQIGRTVTGRVKELKTFGAFVDLGGMDGLLPIGEMSFERVDHPRRVVSVGDEIAVQVIAIEKDRQARGGLKVRLSLTALQPDPWKNAAARLVVGSKISGKLARILPVGAIVEVTPGVEGLIPDHVLEGTSNKLVVGAHIDGTITLVDFGARRLILSLGDPLVGKSLGTFAELFSRKPREKRRGK
jgi:ribosomal protein S1